MAQAYLAEIKIFSFAFAPRNWAQCNGQLLAINQNQALFALLGTQFGGNGQTTFGLPDLRGRTPVHMGPGYNIGQVAGEEQHALTVQEIPAHTHQAVASSNSPDSNIPTNNFWATNTGFTPYSTSANETMNPANITTAGESAPHNNMSPYLTMMICIALVGIFPSRN